ncbi:hypothetical protein RN001_009111 [Aquatica leii]|uniref:HTH CENPB-type domain-containing protein n=1 Tax=Aquatica leii TaxID=1421715 RepID=A0AAN7Q267_9COLE|nr:hypothetical protein RN001_009111 [Aquatica leii]
MVRNYQRKTTKGADRGAVVANEGKGGGGVFCIETELARTLNQMQNWGYGLSREEVLDIVEIYVKRNELNTKFKDGRPGEQWFLNFCTRNKLSLEKPQGVEAARKKQENPWTIYGFIDLVEKPVENLNLTT